jgi:3,4-dihydroxy 2-butanone 4-phosphate synthase/GTP cyclohydrolase II
MVEGGATVISSFLATQIVDRLVVTVAPLMVGGIPAVAGLAGAVPGQALPRLRDVRYQPVGKDMVVSGDVVYE